MFDDNALTMPSEKPRITIRVSEEELNELQQAADEEYRTVPALVLVLVKKFLDDRRQSKSTSPKNESDQK